MNKSTFVFRGKQAIIEIVGIMPKEKYGIDGYLHDIEFTYDGKTLAFSYWLELDITKNEEKENLIYGSFLHFMTNVRSFDYKHDNDVIDEKNDFDKFVSCFGRDSDFIFGMYLKVLDLTCNIKVEDELQDRYYNIANDQHQLWYDTIDEFYRNYGTKEIYFDIDGCIEDKKKNGVTVDCPFGFYFDDNSRKWTDAFLSKIIINENNEIKSCDLYIPEKDNIIYGIDYSRVTMRFSNMDVIFAIINQIKGGRFN